MAYGRELAIRPSVTKSGDKAEKALSSLSGTEREEKKQKLCQRAGECLSSYYAAHPQEWKALRSGL